MLRAKTFCRPMMHVASHFEKKLQTTTATTKKNYEISTTEELAHKAILCLKVGPIAGTALCLHIALALKFLFDFMG